jgi:hypothetical protein
MRMSICSRFNKWLAKRIFDRLTRTVVGVREPDFTIARRGSDLPYMLRWFVIPRNRWLNVYLHHVLRDDDDVLHDHPFASLSLCLDNKLGEVYRTPKGDLTREVEMGDFVYRRATHAHRLYLIDGPAWTIFITGPRIRQWGFWCSKDTPAGGWRPWKEYVSARDRGQVGAGCGEL